MDSATFFQTIDALWKYLRLADLIDIFIVAMLLYAVFNWLSLRTSRGILAVVLIIPLCYGAAIWFDLYLTGILFRTGLMLMVLALVIVLQDDIRRGFEQLGSIRFRRSSGNPNVPIDAVIETVKILAEKRIGALIVYECQEPVARHVRGGIPVNGEISLPLLYSIFHPASPGHDGAVLIRHGKLESLGLHLPLSKNTDALGTRGMRHAAALGLAECCDALVIVVSEEHGAISIAHEGKLTPVRGTDLKSQLDRITKIEAELKSSGGWKTFLYRNWAMKLSAVLTSCLLWFLFAFQIDTIQKNIVVPIEYRNVANGLVVDEPHPTYATLTLSGSIRAFRLYDLDSTVVSFDLAKVGANVPFEIVSRKGLVGIPKEIEVSQIQPERFTITLSRIESRAAIRK